MRPATRQRFYAMMAGFAGSLLVVSLHAAAVEAKFVEPPYNPPIGSRWIVETETRVEEVKPKGPTTTVTRARSELIFEDKTRDGFRITYVNLGIAVDGTARAVPLLRVILKSFENVKIRAITDRSGKPTRVENLAEARAAIQATRADLLRPFKDTPQVADVLDRAMTTILDVDADAAAATYLEDLPSLAKGQSTGMKPGEIRRATDQAANPFGGGLLRSSTTFAMTSADPRAGKVTFVSTRSYDPRSMKDCMVAAARTLIAPAEDKLTGKQVDTIVKSMTLSLEDRAVIDVENGMTRRIEQTTNAAATAMKQTLTKRETKTITVMPAP